MVREREGGEEDGESERDPDADASETKEGGERERKYRFTARKSEGSVIQGGPLPRVNHQQERDATAFDSAAIRVSRCRSFVPRAPAAEGEEDRAGGARPGGEDAAGRHPASCRDVGR